MRPVDVIYPLGSGSLWNDNDELRYSLRALEANFIDLGKVYVVGERPAWLSDRAIHIAAADCHRNNKDANIIDKLLLATTHPAITAQFVRCSDDELFLRPTRFDHMCGRFHGDLHRRQIRGRPWDARLQRTQRYLWSRGYTTRFFDWHVPAPYDTALFRRIARRAPYATGVGLAVDSLYFNAASGAQVAALDGEATRVIAPPESTETLQAQVESKHYLNYAEGALNGVLQAWLGQNFPVPSRFERA